MKPAIEREFRSWFREAMVYGALMVGYCLLVFHLLAAWLNRLFHQQRLTYAIVALAVIVAQGFLLERITAFLLHVMQRGRAGR